MKVVFACAEDEIPGLCYLSAYLKKHGHEVHLVFEPKQFDRAYLRINFLAHIFSRDEENIEKIRRICPDIIGFSCATAHYQWAISFARKVKENFPEIPIIFGGVHPTLIPEVVINEGCVDFICIGEGEEAFTELLDSLKKNNKEHPVANIWYKKDGTVMVNSLRHLNEDLDALPYMDKGLFKDVLPKHYREYCYFFTGRGCPFTCTFCGNEQMKKIFGGLGKYVRRMSVKRVIDELVFIKEKYASRHILFEDDIFTADLKWLREFIPLYKERVNLPFTCFVHPQFLNPEVIGLLKTGGCELLWWGIQSASEEIRRKVFGRYETNDHIIKAADLCHKVKMKFMVDHLLNIPYDSDKAILEAIRLYNRIRPDIINCYNLLYFPKSKIIDVAIEAGLLKTEDIDQINKGESVVYQTGQLYSGKRDFYRRYALLLSSIPLLPKGAVANIGKKNALIMCFGYLPLFFIPLVKVILNFRIGRGFLPLAILKMEIFFTLRFLKGKFKRIFNLERNRKGLVFV